MIKFGQYNLLRGSGGLTMHPRRILWEWYSIVHWTPVIKSHDVNTRYLATELPFWTVFKMAAKQKMATRMFSIINLLKFLICSVVRAEHACITV